MDRLEEKTIKVLSVEANQYGYKIKDEHGLTYNVSKTKKDGGETVAYQNLVSLPGLGMNATINIKYAVVPNKMGGDSRYIRVIEAGSEIKNEARNEARQEPVKYVEQKQRDFEAEAFGKCKYGFLIELMKLGKDLKEAEKISEDWANASMRKMPKSPAELMGQHYTPSTKNQDIQEDDYNMDEISQVPF